MNKFDDNLIKKIKNEYNEITPDSNKLDEIFGAVKKEYLERKTKKNLYMWKRISAFAAMFVAIIILFNIHSVKAFIVEIYQKYFEDVQIDFEENTKEYIKELGLVYNIEGEKILIKEYVITDQGVDFKIVKNDNSKIHICACEIREDNKQTYNEMIIDLEEYLIATNITEDIVLEGEKNIDIALTYYLKDDNEKLYTELLSATLYCDKIYNTMKFGDKHKPIIENDNYIINEISFHTWYMKVTYGVNKKHTDLVLSFKQDNNELTYASGMLTKDGQVSFYQLPIKLKKLEVALMDIYDKEAINSSCKIIDLEKILEEESYE